MNKQNIEVEGGELALRNSHGDVAIIPKADREKVRKMIESGCDACVDKYVNALPTLQDYAADGTLIPDDPPNPLNQSNKPKYEPIREVYKYKEPTPLRRSKIVVLAETPQRDTDADGKPIYDEDFIKESNKLKKYYKGDKDIDIVPLYNDAAKMDSVLSTMNELDDLIIMGHSGSKLCGTANTDIADKIKKNNIKNVYLGSCYGDDLIDSYKNSNATVKYIKDEPWLGVNPNGHTLDSIMYGNKRTDDYYEPLSNNLIEGETILTNDVKENEHYMAYRPELEGTRSLASPTNPKLARNRHNH